MTASGSQKRAHSPRLWPDMLRKQALLPLGVGNTPALPLRSGGSARSAKQECWRLLDLTAALGATFVVQRTCDQATPRAAVAVAS